MTQNLGPYLMRCAIMTQGLFKLGDAYEKNEVHLAKDMIQLKDDLKIQTVKVEELTRNYQR